MTRLRRALLALLCLSSLAAAEAVAKPTDLRTDPVVIAGSELGALEGTTDQRLVAFRLRETASGRAMWKQVPVQLDQRKLVDFGSEPPNNAAAGIEGTVYGTAPIGQAILQYADPQTFVGADPQPGLDPDDEVALLGGDAGERAGRKTALPRRVRGATATRVKIADPLAGDKVSSTCSPPSPRFAARSATMSPTTSRLPPATTDRPTSAPTAPTRRARGSSPTPTRSASPTAGSSTGSRSRAAPTSSMASSSASGRSPAAAAKRPSTKPRAPSSPTSTGR